MEYPRLLSCLDADHTCVHDALAADFAALCDAVATQCANCATSDRCVALTKRCADGLTLPDHPPTTTTPTSGN